MVTKKLIFFLILFLFIPLAVHQASATTNLISPVENGNYSTSLTINVTTNVINPLNATIYYNSSGGTAASILTTLTNDTAADVEFYSASFDISGLTDAATYNFSTTVNNGTTTETTSNDGITIDNTEATVTFGQGTASDGAAFSTTSIYVNVSIVETNEKNITFLLHNSTSQVTSTTFTDNTRTINWTGLPEGNYTYNVTVKDYAGNSKTSTTRTIYLDSSNPSVSSFSCTPTTARKGSTIACSCSGTDSISGVASTSYTTNPSTTSTGTFTTSCTVTDQAGNSASSSLSYTITSSGSSDPNYEPPFWTRTYAHDQNDINEEGKITRNLKSQERIRIIFNEEEHHVGIKSIAGNTATLEIASTPLEATLTAGESKKFDLDNDGYYDILVEVNNISDSVDLSISPIHEEVSQVDKDASSQENNTENNDENDTGESQKIGRGSTILLALLVLVIIAGVAWYITTRKKSEDKTESSVKPKKKNKSK